MPGTASVPAAQYDAEAQAHHVEQMQRKTSSPFVQQKKGDTP